MAKSCRDVVSALLLASFNCGCASFWYDLQPHRLQRLNRIPAPSFNPDFTQSTLPANTRLVRLEGSPTPAEMTANRAEVILARGQSPIE